MLLISFIIIAIIILVAVIKIADTKSWDSLETAKLLVNIYTPLTVVFLGFLINQHFNSLESAKEEERRILESIKEKEREEREEQRKKIERTHAHRIEFDINCNFFGPHNGSYVAEFIVTVNNKGRVRHQFDRIILRVLGIREKSELAYRKKKGYEKRLDFPEKIFKDEVIPKNLKFIFVEPNVRQTINFTSLIDDEYKYIVAHAEFHYDKYTPHTAEKVFEVKSSNMINPACNNEI